MPQSNLSSEKLFPVSQIAGMLPGRWPDKPLSRSAVYRWISIGVKGTRLEVRRLGGRMMTSEQAIERFIERLSSGEGASNER